MQAAASSATRPSSQGHRPGQATSWGSSGIPDRPAAAEPATRPAARIHQGNGPQSRSVATSHTVPVRGVASMLAANTTEPAVATSTAVNATRGCKGSSGTFTANDAASASTKNTGAEATPNSAIAPSPTATASPTGARASSTPIGASASLTAGFQGPTIPSSTAATAPSTAAKAPAAGTPIALSVSSTRHPATSTCSSTANSAMAMAGT